jgi:hypothetical protein
MDAPQKEAVSKASIPHPILCIRCAAYLLLKQPPVESIELFQSF